MENTDIKKLIDGKTTKEKLYILRDILVKESCEEVRKNSKIYQKFNERHPELKEDHILVNPSVRQRTLEDLEEEGFNLKDKGTQYLATLITIYFHERKLFRIKNFTNQAYFDKTILRYFNLNRKDNEHYSMLGTTKEKAVKEMNNAIAKSNNPNTTIEEIVYDIADYYITKHREDGDEKNVSYTKNL